jgi:hypothetical protein
MSVRDWAARKVASDPAWTPESDPSGAPPVSVEALTQFADGVVKFKKLQMTRLYKSALDLAQRQPYKSSYGNDYREGGINVVRNAFREFVTAEDLALSDAVDARYGRPAAGPRAGAAAPPAPGGEMPVPSNAYEGLSDDELLMEVESETNPNG